MRLVDAFRPVLAKDLELHVRILHPKADNSVAGMRGGWSNRTAVKTDRWGSYGFHALIAPEQFLNPFRDPRDRLLGKRGYDPEQ